MLTGDKLETAENIAISCWLIEQDFYKIYFDNNIKRDNQEDSELSYL